MIFRPIGFKIQNGLLCKVSHYAFVHKKKRIME